MVGQAIEGTVFFYLNIFIINKCFFKSTPMLLIFHDIQVM